MYAGGQSKVKTCERRDARLRRVVRGCESLQFAGSGTKIIYCERYSRSYIDVFRYIDDSYRDSLTIRLATFNWEYPICVWNTHFTDSIGDPTYSKLYFPVIRFPVCIHSPPEDSDA